jgi:type VI protein secretion system component VasK
MHLDQIAGLAVDHLFGRMMRRALLAFLVAALAIAAIYHFTVAGTLSLEAQYGALHAQLIVGAIFTALALLAYAILWAMRNKAASASTPVLSGQREMQMAMLVEAVMLGYALARKGERTR